MATRIITKVTTQDELDKALLDPDTLCIDIVSPKGVWLAISNSYAKSITAHDSSSIVAHGSVSITAYDSSSITAHDSSSISAQGSVSITAYDSSSISAQGLVSVTAYDSSSIMAYDSVSVTAYDSVSVTAYDSVSVRAHDSSSISAYNSVSVTAHDSVSVRAYDSGWITAHGSSSVAAHDSVSVRAHNSVSVTAHGSSSITAHDSVSITAGGFVAVRLLSKLAKVKGGHVIDMADLDLSKIDAWASYHGVEIIDGEAIVYKAVDSNLRSGQGVYYPIGERVDATDWKPGDFCGNGLHFSPWPHQAHLYFGKATRFLKVAVKLDELTVIDGNTTNMTPKLKAKGARVLAEVTIDANPV
jgi:uncharacterized protein (DUF2345 family)